VAQELTDRGWTDVHALKGGFEAWDLAGYPLTLKN
jgi:rhodanese-related sulfurtransferase